MTKFMFRNTVKNEKPENCSKSQYNAYKRDYMKARLFMERFLEKWYGKCCYDKEEYYCEECGSCRAYKHLDLIYDNPF